MNNFAGVGIPGNVGMPAMGNALDVVCPKCGAYVGNRCFLTCKTTDARIPCESHVERARVARYRVMGVQGLETASHEERKND